MTSTEQIAKIQNVSLGWEDHGILTCYVALDFGSSGQTVGGYSLDEPQHDEDKKFTGRRGTAFGMEWVVRLMRAAGVSDFKDVQGRTVLAVRDGDKRNGRVVGLKPLPTEQGEPFMFDDLAIEFYGEGACRA